MLLMAFGAAFPVQAEEKTFGEWIVVQSDDGDYIAATGRDDGKQMLAFRCFGQMQQCVHVLVADTRCNDGKTYPILVNSDHAALSMNTVCSENDGTYELLLNEYDAIHSILRESDVVGFAIPMASGEFKAVRFSMDGSVRAMDYVKDKTAKKAGDTLF